MRISDWSSDVCSSDLPAQVTAGETGRRAFAAAGADPVEMRHHQRPDVRRELVHPRGDHAVGEVGTRHVGAIEEAGPQIGAGEVGVGQARVGEVDLLQVGAAQAGTRSEEHTSELQSLMRISYA